MDLRVLPNHLSPQTQVLPLLPPSIPLPQSSYPCFRLDLHYLLQNLLRFRCTRSRRDYHTSKEWRRCGLAIHSLRKRARKATLATFCHHCSTKHCGKRVQATSRDKIMSLAVSISFSGAAPCSEVSSRGQVWLFPQANQGSAHFWRCFADLYANTKIIVNIKRVSLQSWIPSKHSLSL